MLPDHDKTGGTVVNLFNGIRGSGPFDRKAEVRPLLPLVIWSDYGCC
jgi:hypothetical protein